MPPDLALLPTLTGSNYPCLELIFMVPKVFEPLKFDCIFMFLISVFSSPQINILMPALLPQFCTSILEVLPPPKGGLCILVSVWIPLVSLPTSAFKILVPTISLELIHGTSPNLHGYITYYNLYLTPLLIKIMVI